jgi:hypothetical protein
MSKNTNLSFLTDYITADITNGRIGINNASPAVAFDVVGATKITGVLTLTSTISNGTNTYTLPSATGTLALTSALSGYLPLTGGTLTGALGGTTASFSGNLVLSGSDARINGGDSVGRLLLTNSNTTTYIGLYGATHPTLPYIMSFVVNSASALAIASTGAATFSSSVTALKYIANSQATYASLTYEETFKYASSPAGIWFGNSFNSNNNVALQLRTSNDGTSVQALTITPTGASTFQSVNAKVNTGGWHLLVQDNTSMASGVGGGISFNGYKTGTTAQGVYAAIDGFKENATSGNELGGFRIWTSNGTNLVERVRVTSAGNVGIGTSTPANNTNQTSLTINGPLVSRLDMQVGGTRNAGFVIATDAAYLETTAAIPLVFYTNSLERMRITSGGNVGIGRSNPDSYKLEVGGTVFANSFLSATSYSYPTVNVWTTFYTMASERGIYSVMIGLASESFAEWQSYGVVFCQGSTGVFSTLYNSSLVQMRLSGLNIQVLLAPGAGFTRELTFKVLRT